MNIRRWECIYIIFGLMLIGELAGLFLNSGTVAGISERADRLKVIAAAESDDDTILPGDIYDRNGNIIAETDYKKVRDGSKDGGEVTKRVTKYADGEAYSQLIGYTGSRSYYAYSGSSEDGVIGSRNEARLMAFLNEEYWGSNGIYSTTDINGTRGQSAELTIDSDLQMKVFAALKDEMSSSKDIGSAVVMNAKTGEILADVCFPTYDFNNLSEALKQMNEDSEKTDLEPGYPVTYKNPVAPGSIFKILMAVSLVDNGMEDYTVENSSYTMENGWTCKARPFDNGVLKVQEGDILGLEQALNVSSNVYFSKAALALGRSKISETARKFMFEEGESFVELDFGNLMYNWDLSGSNEELAQTGFGQGKTEWSTICAAMVTQAIANKGVLMKPYMVMRLKDADGNTVYEGSPEALSQAASEEASRKVTKMMYSTAEATCIALNDPYVTEVFSKCRVAGKTGTSENGDEKETVNTWFVSFAPAEDPEYVVVVNQCKTTGKAGSSMMNTTAKIYEYLFR